MTVTDADLRSLVAQYELAQRNRIASGAYLHAGGAPGDCPPLRALYEAEWRTERALAKSMAAHVQLHPAWPWLERVRGIGTTLASRLLARLRIERAPTPSSFWQYCGLATVPGERYECFACGATVTLVAGRTPPARHHRPDGGACAARMSADGALTVRVAMRYPLRGQRRSFDVGARTLCHLVGMSFVRRGGRYRQVYDERRERLSSQHPTWTALHQHLAAMRVIEKLFLAHLWAVWRERIGGNDRKPYETARRGRAGVLISPWKMVDD